jgi:hypothetical protein
MKATLNKKKQGFVGDLVWRSHFTRFAGDDKANAYLTLSNYAALIGVRPDEVGGLIAVLEKFKKDSEAL